MALQVTAVATSIVILISSLAQKVTRLLLRECPDIKAIWTYSYSRKGNLLNGIGRGANGCYDWIFLPIIQELRDHQTGKSEEHKDEDDP